VTLNAEEGSARPEMGEYRSVKGFEDVEELASKEVSEEGRVRAGDTLSRGKVRESSKEAAAIVDVIERLGLRGPAPEVLRVWVTSCFCLTASKGEGCVSV
jgi:hypothetical protein